MQSIKLKSKDGKIFETELAVARCSVTIRTMLDCLGINEANPYDDVVPLFEVESAILTKVLEFCDHHKEDMGNGSWLWDSRFLEVDQDTLHKLIIAANYLEIPRLFTAACEKVQRLSEIAANNDMMMYRFGLYQSGKCCELPMSPDDAPRPSVIIDDTPEIDIDSI